MATILDAFLVTLKLDNKEFKTGEEEAEKLYDELVRKATENAKAIVAAAQGKSAEEIATAKASAKELIKTEEHAAHTAKANLIKATKEANEKIKEQTERGKEFFKGVTEAAAEFFGIMVAAAGMVEFIKSTLEAEVGAGRLAKTLNVDVEELEALQGAVKRVGGTSEGLDASLKGLNARLEMIAIHGPRSKMALQVFAGLGISAVALKGKDAIGVLGLLAEKMHGMSEAKAMGLGERLGLDEGTIRLLVKGKEGMAALVEHQKALGVASAEQGEQAEKLEQSMLDFKDSASATGRELLSVLMPALTGIANALAAVSGWMSEHGETVKVTLIGIGTAMVVMNQSAIAGAAKVAAQWLATIPASLAAGLGFTGAGEAAVAAETAATLGINWIVVAIEAAIVALYEMVKHWKDVRHWANETALDIVYHLALAFFKVEHAGAKMWNSLKTSAMAPLEWIWNKLKAIIDLAKQEGSFISAILHGNVKGAVGAIKAAVGDVGSVTGLTHAYAGAPAASAGMALRPSSISNSHATSTNHRETHIGQITVQTQATDAQGIASGIGGAIKSHSLIDINQADGGF
jgi:hypothetical protein